MPVPVLNGIKSGDICLIVHETENKLNYSYEVHRNCFQKRIFQCLQTQKVSMQRPNRFKLH